MKKLLACLLILALSLSACALAESLPGDEIVFAQRESADAAVEEVSPIANLIEDLPQSEEASPEEPLSGDEPPAEEEPIQDPVQEPPSVLGDPLVPRVISVSGNTRTEVYLAVPYVLEVRGGIKRARSNNSAVASVSKSGAVSLSAEGTAKITVTTLDGDKLAVRLTVLPPPTPTDVKVKFDGAKATLSWKKAPFATRYMVQASPDGQDWTDFKRVKKPKKRLNVTDAIAGNTWFRVVPILGDVFGRASAPVSCFEPITGVRVVCQESKNEGPTDRMNVLWDACKGATGYAVYHVLLPSDDYTLLGTTDKTWYPVTRAATRLDAYRVIPLFGDVELPASDSVTLWTGYQDNVLPPSKLTSSTGIILVVNKKAQVVTAYVQDGEGEYTVPLRHMICSSGKVYGRTKNGTYQLKARKGEWYRYPSGCYIRWPSIYRSGYYFHSPLYTSGKRINTSTVKRLGTRQSLGCIRLKVRDAEWVYKHCAAGTAVYICDGGARDSLKKALKPKAVSVSGF